MRWRVRRAAILWAALLAACGQDLAGTKLADVSARQRAWQARGITSYRYDFDQGGFFNACQAPLWVFVHAGQVDSAIVIATGKPAQYPGFCAPTIAQLFETADSAAARGSLAGIHYNAAFGYPTEIDISGPPDASGWLRASFLQPSP